MSIPTDSRHHAAPLIRRLAKALLICGVPAPRLESALTAVAARFDLRAQFFATPTSVMGAIGDDDSQDVFLLRGDQGEIDVARTDALHDLLRDLTDEAYEVDVEAERARIQTILDAPPIYRPYTDLAAFILLSAAVARVFGGGWHEMLVAATIGLQSGLIGWLASRSGFARRLAVAGASFLAGLTAALASGVIGELSAYLVTIAGLIVFVPGLMLTTAAREIASGHLVSGSARMAGAGIVFMMIAFGVAVGTGVGATLLGLAGRAPVEALPTPLPEWTLVPALIAATISLTILFRVPAERYLWVLAVGLLAFFSARLGAFVEGPAAGAGIGALLVGVGGNLYARYRDHVSLTLHVPGLMMLVPGAIGFQSLAALLNADVAAGVQAAFTAAMVAVALSTGLVIANGFVPSRRLL